MNNFVKVPSQHELEEKLKAHFGKKITVEVREDIYFKIFGIWMMLPKGLKSDGASIPKPLQFIIDGYDMRILFFSILHDYFYRTQFVPRQLADSIYKAGLEITANRTIAASFYYVLRVFGSVAWKNNKKAGLETFPNAQERLKDWICNK
jgi:hypothetical protein